jgi:hypothetical protein
LPAENATYHKIYGNTFREGAFLPKPIYAFADSRLLFWKKEDGSLFLNEIKQNFNVEHLSAAYIGASNNDNLELYHGIFEPAMQQIGIENCEMVLTRPLPAAGMFLEQANIILLAGGSVEIGWRAFERNGFKELILRRFHDGAVLIGISAGAVQLGRGSLTDNGLEHLSTFGLLPFYVGVHEESEDWTSLRNSLSSTHPQMRAIGIPSGGGITYDYDTGEVKPVCKSIVEILFENGRSRESIIFPKPSGAD